MPYLKRRQFLQFAGSTLATLGLSQLDIIRQGDRYARVLARDTRRKLALLVGINDYPFGNTLHGCLTDVDLQQNLLIHRFGFAESDIHILRDKQATRQGILTAFEEHLIKQAKPGDVVVFHYSGHGSEVTDPDCVYKNFKDDSGNCLNSTFVPIDNTLSLEARDQQGGVVPDITGHTLFLLMSALQTENVTVVLDSCHSGGGKRGNLTVRSLGGGPQLEASPEEIEYQRQWRSRLHLSPQEDKRQRQAGVAKGVVIASTGPNQLAADAPFRGFPAGAFTYTMTQYLWQQTGNESSESAIANIGRSTTQIARDQNPESEFKLNSRNAQQPIYFVSEQSPPAEAVITKVGSDGVELWLGGVNADSITAFDKGATLTLVDATGHPQGLVQLDSREGLIAKARPVKNTQLGLLQPGAFLQEKVRVVPADVSLRIGLDPSLGGDITKAEQGLRGIKQVKALPIQQGQDVEYILGRMTQDNLKFQHRTGDALPAVGSIGLFTPGLELIPGSFDAAGEPVDAAVIRLKSKFKALLAAHLAKMILNPGSSRLNVAVSMHAVGTNSEVLASTFTVRGSNKPIGAKSTPPSTRNRQQLEVGTRLQFRIANKEDRDLHVSVLVIDPEGEMTVVFPNTWTTTAAATLVRAGETLQLPETGKDRFKLTVVGNPVGTVEVLVIASSTPLADSLKALQTIASRGGQVEGKRGQPLTLVDDDPTVVVNSLLSDLNRGTRGGGGIAASADTEVRGVDASQLAAMSITFESIEKRHS